MPDPGDASRTVSVCVVPDKATAVYDAILSRISALWFVVVPHVPACSPVAIFSIPKDVVYVEAIIFSYAAISVQLGV